MGLLPPSPLGVSPKDVERLPSVREATSVVSQKVRAVVFFEDGFPQKDEGPGDDEAIGCLPFTPHAEEGIPGLPGGSAIHETVLGRFRGPLIATFASGR